MGLRVLTSFRLMAISVGVAFPCGLASTTPIRYTAFLALITYASLVFNQVYLIGLLGPHAQHRSGNKHL